MYRSLCKLWICHELCHLLCVSLGMVPLISGQDSFRATLMADILLNRNYHVEEWNCGRWHCCLIWVVSNLPLKTLLPNFSFLPPFILSLNFSYSLFCVFVSPFSYHLFFLQYLDNLAKRANFLLCITFQKFFPFINIYIFYTILYFELWVLTFFVNLLESYSGQACFNLSFLIFGCQ